MSLRCIYCGKERKKNGKPYKTQQNLLDHEKQCPSRGTSLVVIKGKSYYPISRDKVIKVEPKIIVPDFSHLPQALPVTKEYVEL